MVWKQRPTTTGYYWMRWRRKWGRFWSHDVVWFAEGNPDEVRLMSWRAIADWPRAMFHGPLNPPEPAAPRRPGARP